MRSYYAKLVVGLPAIVGLLLVASLTVQNASNATDGGMSIDSMSSPTSMSAPDWASHPNAEFAVRFSGVELCDCVTVDTQGNGTMSIYPKAGAESFMNDIWFYLDEYGGYLQRGSPIVATGHTTGNCTGTPSPDHYQTLSITGGDIKLQVTLYTQHDVGWSHEEMTIFESGTYPGVTPGQSAIMTNVNTICYADGLMADVGGGGYAEIVRRP